MTRATGFSNEELAGFINRQLVETRQGTKAITQILKEAFKNDDTRIVFTKAEVTADFRHKYELPKARSVNNLHHAHDAYLNIVAGNVYDAKFTSHPINFIKECRSKGVFNYNMAKVFDYNVKRGTRYVWIAQNDGMDMPLSIERVKKQLARNTILMTRRSYMAHGGISNKATIYGKDTAKPGSYLPVKSSDPRLSDVTKYGGITSVLNTAYALVEYKVKGKVVRSLESVPLYVGATGKDDEKLLNYLQESLQLENKKNLVENVSVRLYPVRQRSLLKLDGYYYHLGGMTGNSFYLLDAVPLLLPISWIGYIKKIEKAVEKQSFNEIDKSGERVITNEKNIELYIELRDKLKHGMYRNKKCSISESLIVGENKFLSLNIIEQCKILSQILVWFNTAQQNIDLQKIGGSAHVGTLMTSKKLSNLSEAILIEQSATGLYERRIDLLTV